VDRLAAQLIAVPALNFDLPGLEPLIKAGVGGILFVGSAPAPSNLADLVAAANSVAPDHVSPFVMADEEGGGIQRLAGVVPSFPWPRQIAETMTPAQTMALGESVGHQMAQVGVNMDLAPVLDVDGGVGPSATDPDGSRSFSPDPATAARYGTAFMQGLRQGGVIPVIKHFPGLGGSTGDTDDGPAATQPIAVLRASGLPPFQAAISAGAPAVMVSNATVPGLTTVPASLSSAVITGLLRQTLGFTGLVLTDSLSAGAISEAGDDLPQAAVAALGAGADMILFGSTLTPAQTELLQPSNVINTVATIGTAINSAVVHGVLSNTTLVAAVTQVLSAKHADLCTTP
jgi:beta-N-acetylhexosaminidase